MTEILEGRPLIPRAFQSMMYKEKVSAARAVTLASSYIVQQGLKVRECNNCRRQEISGDSVYLCYSIHFVRN